MADTVAVMNQGRIEQLGAPAELYDLPRTAFVANFLGQSNTGVGTDQGRRRRPPRRRRARHAGQDPQVPLAGARGRGAVRRPAGEGDRVAQAARRAPATTSGAWCATCPSSGVATSYLVDMPSGTTWSCYEQNLDVEPLDLRPGDEVWLDLEPRARVRRPRTGRPAVAARLRDRMSALAQVAGDPDLEPAPRRRPRPSSGPGRPTC